MKKLLTLALASTLLSATGCQSSQAGTFDTPEAALQHFAEAVDDPEAADELLGPGGFDLLRSGDAVADREDVEAVRALILERVAFEEVGEDCRIALLGNDAWEMPIPLVRVDGRWRFDVEAGREETLNRRVGRNELSTLATMRALVDAQREYAAEGRDGQPPAFAQRLHSTPGKHDGLFWAAAEGEPESPLGPLVAEAAEEGYRADQSKPVPYHGYYYRLLTEQGPHAPGGKRSYLDGQGRLTAGFAYVAWPATYGNSGVMTFLVNRQGIVFQKDLGAQTATIASALRAFDPDPSWTPTSD